MAFRFVHTADIHLDLPLRTLALREPALAELIGGAEMGRIGQVIDFTHHLHLPEIPRKVCPDARVHELAASAHAVFE